MWQRFSKIAKRTVFYAQEAAAQYGTTQVSTEHLLLGLLHQVEHPGVWPPPPIDRMEAGDAAGFVLREIGGDIAAIRAEIEQRVQSSIVDLSRDAILTSEGKRAIDLAFQEARSLGHSYIGTEHLLLGLICEENGMAGRVLALHGIDIEKARLSVAGLPAGSIIPTESRTKAAKASLWSRLFAKRPAIELGEKNLP